MRPLLHSGGVPRWHHKEYPPTHTERPGRPSRQQLPRLLAPRLRHGTPPRARRGPLLPPPTCSRPKGGDTGTAHRPGHWEQPLSALSTGQAAGGSRQSAAGPRAVRPAPFAPPPAFGGGSGRRGVQKVGQSLALRPRVGRRIWTSGQGPPSGGRTMVQAAEGAASLGFKRASYSSGLGRAPARRPGRVSAAGHLRPRGGSRWREQGGVLENPDPTLPVAPSQGRMWAFWRWASSDCQDRELEGW
jgi:hypothetical protein